MVHQLPCTMFCASDGGRAWSNVFSTGDTDEAINQDIDDDHDKDVEDDDNDEEDNVLNVGFVVFLVLIL